MVYRSLDLPVGEIERVVRPPRPRSSCSDGFQDDRCQPLRGKEIRKVPLSRYLANCEILQRLLEQLYEATQFQIVMWSLRAHQIECSRRDTPERQGIKRPGEVRGHFAWQILCERTH